MSEGSLKLWIDQDQPENANTQARQSGEVDIFEILRRSGTTEAISAPNGHTYGFEWLPGKMRLYLDGKLVTPSHPDHLDPPDSQNSHDHSGQRLRTSTGPDIPHGYQGRTVGKGEVQKSQSSSSVSTISPMT